MAYDSNNRLATASGIWGNSAFSYDGVGNISSKTVGSHVLNYTYDANNRLSSVNGSLARSYTYDLAGNVTNDGVTNNAYNLQGEMISRGSTILTYDGDGHRVKKSGAQGTEYSFFDRAGRLMFQELENGDKVDFVYLDSTLVAEITKDSSTQIDQTTFVLSDLAGSPIFRSDSLGNSLGRVDFRPFGEQHSTTDDGVGYTGHLQDPDMGLTYMRARYYDPVIGRFLSVDPLAFSADDTMTFNRYAYANNNPYKYTDPTGEGVAIVGCIGPQAAVCGGVLIIGGIIVVIANNSESDGGSSSSGSSKGDDPPGATEEDAKDRVTGGKEKTKTTGRSGVTTEHFPPVSGEEADEVMDEVKDLPGVKVKETENERGPVTVVVLPDGSRVIDRVGGGGVRSIETQSPNGKEKTKTRVRLRD